MKNQFLDAGISIIMVLLGTAILSFSCQMEQKVPQRHAFVIGLKPGKMDEYKKLHAEPWPEILELLKQCHIQNYSIHLGEPEEGSLYLFGYFESLLSD